MFLSFTGFKKSDYTIEYHKQFVPNGHANGMARKEKTQNGHLNGNLHREKIQNGHLNGTLRREKVHNGYLNRILRGEKTPLLAREESTELSSHKTKSSRQPSLFKVLIKTFWKQWLYSSCLRLLDDALCLSQPFILRCVRSFTNVN